jgi:hypothetical protein
MDAERWRRIHDVFQAAMACAAAERPAFLAEACLGDAVLRQQVDQLLEAHQRAGDFLEAAAFSHGIRVLATDDRPSAFSTYGAGSDFRGTERYTVLRRLGAGGMGIVYEVHDRTRDEIVALKTVLRARAADIYRLKREFRSLAGVAHTNLVSLYELVVGSEHCFFTMELVKGVNVVDYVRGSSAHATFSSQAADRARSVLRQLVDGLSALHQQGKLHRDIKPSNVLVTPDGRVVILDFGLLSDVLPHGAGDIESIMAGTPAYIAPEQGSGAVPSEANDWYSAGVTVYEALTGRLPFDGPPYEVFLRKRESDPMSPADIARGVPDDLSAICMGLLCRDPARRLSGRDALRTLASGEVVSESPRSARRHRESPFVGRDRQLEVLNTAFLGASHGCAGVVCIHGPSGIGKSALVQCFLDRLVERQDVAVLRGRCYEHESVPYKALDGVIDSLSQHLDSLPRSQAETLIPRDVLTLSRLFPVMLQVEAVATAPRLGPESPDPLILRRRAFSALRELLTRMATRQPMVLYIDDLHWADADGALLIEELIRPPHAPPLLMVACFRTEEIASKPFLQRLVETAGSNGCMALPLGPMTESEAGALVASLIPADSPVSEAEKLGIVAEGGGTPFLLEQLTRHVVSNETGRDRGATFVEMLDGRVRALPPEAQRFLDTLAICGRPMAPELVYEASGLAGDERPLVALLRSGHFVRSSGSAQRVEMYHDRIRETLAARVSAEDERRIHGLLVRTLLATGADDSEALYVHYRGAGDRARASAQAARAAKKANEALAFDRAAVFYRAALELAPDSPVRFEWKKGLAGALANAGRPTEAADVYLESAHDADSTRRVELRRRTAEQMLIGGHIDRGLQVIRAVLSDVGIRFATSSRMVLASLLFRRAQLRWRGLEFAPRAADQIAADELLRIDTCWSVATGLGLVDHVRAADFQTRHLLLALDAGEPYRIARGHAMEVGFSAAAGGPRMQRTAELIERAQTMANSVGHPHAIALATLMAGLAAYLVGQWRKAAVLCGRALGILSDQCVGVTWELNLGQNVLLASMLYQGELREVSRRLPAILATARERGNLYIETELRTRMILTWLAADDPEEGERQANDIMAQWSHRGYHRQHHNHLLTRIQIELYRGRAEQAWQLIVENWTAVKRSHLLRVQWMRIEASYVRARCALLMAASGRGNRFLSVARDEARRIERDKMPWSDPLALLLRAAVASLEGNASLAEQRLAGAVEGFDLAEMKMYAAVSRRRLGTLVGGDRGHELIRQADEWMAAEDIKNVASMTRLIAPGFADAP